MKAFMRHLSTRYGANELDNWRMELWFDEQRRDDRKAWDEYLKMFTITYRAVKSCNDSISLGGYGIRMDYGGDARIEFFKLWKRSAPLPDFISVMYYAYARGEDGKDLSARRVTDDAAFKKFLEEEKKRLQKAGMGDIPVNICEWNFTPSVRNIINDSCYKGAYVMRNILDVYQLAQSMGYGAGSDLLFSSYDTSDMLFGGAGLITRDGIMKPAGYAMGFLNRTFSNLIGIDTNYLITTDEHNNYVVVCHNQQKLNEQYYLTPETQIRRDADWKYFDDLHRLKLRIVLRDVKEGHYRIRIYRVNNHCGSVLDTWESMDFENELSRDDISYLQRTCVPKVTIQKTETVQGNLVIQAELDPNEIARISVRYIS